MASVWHGPAAGRALAIWVALSAVGVAVRALPDGGDHGSWWVIGAIVATAAQVSAALGAARHTPRPQATP